MTYHHDLPSRTVDQGNRLDEDEVRAIVELYEAELKARTVGPQLEGLEGSQLTEALRNDPENVLLLDIVNDQGEITGKWPLLVPVEYHQDYSKLFFESHHPDRAAYHFSLPPYENIESLMQTEASFEHVAQFLKQKNAIVAYDYREGDDGKELTPALIQKMLAGSDAHVEDITPESSAWGMEYGLPLALHYEGIARLKTLKDEPAPNVAVAIENLIAAGEIERLPGNGVTFLGPEELTADNNKILGQLWEIYSEQFDELIEDHPILGEQPREEFEAMLLDKGTVNTAFMVDGNVAGLMYMVNDIEKCVWLNKDHFDKEFEGEAGWMTHFPGIVVAKDKARQGAGYAQQMMDMTLKAIAEMNKDLIITFACSNVSSKYIPKMVRRGVNDSPLYEFADDETDLHMSAEYGYRVLEVS